MDWIDELRSSEPQRHPVSTREMGKEVLESFNSVDDVWDEVRWEDDYSNPREVEDTGFRIPLRQEDRPSCLGKAVAVAIYSEFESGHDLSVKVQYDDIFDIDGTRSLDSVPHVALTIDGEDYGVRDYRHTDELNVAALRDLYRLGLGTEVFNDDRDLNISNQTFLAWGNEIKDNYSEGRNNSSYIARMGAQMVEDAQNQTLTDSGFDYVA
jgi:hypothetical protein